MLPSTLWRIFSHILAFSNKIHISYLWENFFGAINMSINVNEAPEQTQTAAFDTQEKMSLPDVPKTVTFSSNGNSELSTEKQSDADFWKPVMNRYIAPVDQTSRYDFSTKVQINN